MIQLIILSLCFSMIFAQPRMSLDPGYANFASDYCPSNSVRLSDDCKMALRCLSGDVDTQITRCYRYGWRLKSGTCHGVGDQFSSSSTCSQNLRARKDQCKKTPKAHLPDSKFCHIYYDCSDPTESKICPYPKLFSANSRRCEDFRRVKCGSRIELKSYCHYTLRPCKPYCYPCEVYHPSCEGYPDGRSFHSKKKSPWYMVCDGERFVREGRCRMTRYGPDPLCMTKIDCGSNENRYYATKDCRSYIWCYYGRTFGYWCPAGTVFNKKRGSCQHLYDTCKPCGTKSC